VQSLTTAASATLSGSFTLEFEGSVTASLNFDASADDVKASLEVLPTINSVSVSRVPTSVNFGHSWFITFNDNVGNQPLLTIDTSSLVAIDASPISTTIHEILAGSSSSMGGKCSPGYVCLLGARTPTPNDQTTGYPAPPGTYSLAGASKETGCNPGTYNPTHGKSFCLICPAGSICQANTTIPLPCEKSEFCVEGSFKGEKCPIGTYGDSTSLTNSSQCLPCPGAKFCRDGVVSGDCSQGHFCRSGMGEPTPEVVYNPSQLFDIEGFWSQQNGGQCPPGHYCQNATSNPVQCPNSTTRSTTHGVDTDDCGLCPAGYICWPGDPVPTPCYTGYYCKEVR